MGQHAQLDRRAHRRRVDQGGHAVAGHAGGFHVHRSQEREPGRHRRARRRLRRQAVGRAEIGAHRHVLAGLAQQHQVGDPIAVDVGGDESSVVLGRLVLRVPGLLDDGAGGRAPPVEGARETGARSADAQDVGDPVAVEIADQRRRVALSRDLGPPLARHRPSGGEGQHVDQAALRIDTGHVGLAAAVKVAGKEQVLGRVGGQAGGDVAGGVIVGLGVLAHRVRPGERQRRPALAGPALGDRGDAAAPGGRPGLVGDAEGGHRRIHSADGGLHLDAAQPDGGGGGHPRLVEGDGVGTGIPGIGEVDAASIGQPDAAIGDVRDVVLARGGVGLVGEGGEVPVGIGDRIDRPDGDDAGRGAKSGEAASLGPEGHGHAVAGLGGEGAGPAAAGPAAVPSGHHLDEAVDLGAVDRAVAALGAADGNEPLAVQAEAVGRGEGHAARRAVLGDGGGAAHHRMHAGQEPADPQQPIALAAAVDQ